MSGKLEAIWIKPAPRQPMDPVHSAQVRSGAGLVGNANQGGRRQITLVSSEAWAQAQQELPDAPGPVTRRANLLLSGIDLEESRGRVLMIGPISVLIRGETKPCNRMERACPGLREALTPQWRGGAYGEVLEDGEVAVGDSVRWAEGA